MDDEADHAGGYAEREPFPEPVGRPSCGLPACSDELHLEVEERGEAEQASFPSWRPATGGAWKPGVVFAFAATLSNICEARCSRVVGRRRRFSFGEGASTAAPMCVRLLSIKDNHEAPV